VLLFWPSWRVRHIGRRGFGGGAGAPMFFKARSSLILLFARNVFHSPMIRGDGMPTPTSGSSGVAPTGPPKWSHRPPPLTVNVPRFLARRSRTLNREDGSGRIGKDGNGARNSRTQPENNLTLTLTIEYRGALQEWALRRHAQRN
jgi:hypothetical protein